MSKIIIIGAGLSGITAGICLANQGFEVEIWDQGNEVGGASLDQGVKLQKPLAIADMTPFDAEGLSRYLGFNIGPDKEHIYHTDYSKPLASARFYISDKQFEMNFRDDLHMKLIERGGRPSSLDRFLYNIALHAGVKFRYNSRVESKNDFSELPDGSIIATGMFRQSFIALDVPFTPVFAFFAGRELENFNGPETIVYLDKFTKDYGYFTYINGMGTAILFQRGKGLSNKALEWFKSRLFEDAGLDFNDWRYNENYMCTPTGSLFNPRIFHDRFILAGTLAGFQDPSWVLGVHGALVSEKIAAMAVKDKDKALNEFHKMNRWWKLCCIGKRFFNLIQPLSRELIYKPVIKSETALHKRYMWSHYPAIPGLKQL